MKIDKSSRHQSLHQTQSLSEWKKVHIYVLNHQSESENPAFSGDTMVIWLFYSHVNVIEVTIIR